MFVARNFSATCADNNKYRVVLHAKKLDNITYDDIIDMIWMPKYRWDREIESIVVELVEAYNDIIGIDVNLLETLRKSLVLWAGKYVLEEYNIEKVIGGLKLSSQEANSSFHSF